MDYYGVLSRRRFKSCVAFTADLEKAARAPLWLLRKSKPEGVLLSVEKFQELIDIAEDYFLSVKAKDYEQEDKTKVKWISHEEVKKQLNV